MIAKIGRGINVLGVLSYNQQKVDKEKGSVLLMHKMIDTPDGRCSVKQLSRSFEPYLSANVKTEKPVLHISLNPDPQDRLSDEQLKNMAKQYMKEMGYGQQPFVVFKHTDTGRSHIHIVSVVVDEQGKKIDDSFEKRRSMAVCRKLEQQYHLIPATQKDTKKEDRIFKAVDYRAGDIKSQMASVLRHIHQYYRFTGLGTYNALLSLYNIKAEEVKGELRGQLRQGMVYLPLNEAGEKISNPFKASLFGKQAGYAALQNHYASSRESLKNDPAKESLKSSIRAAIRKTSKEKTFIQQLSKQGINTVVRRNEDGRVYGISFIDHPSKTVWNGSQLGKEFSANLFNEWWNNNQKSGLWLSQPILPKDDHTLKVEQEKPHELFDFGNRQTSNESIDIADWFEALGSLLPVDDRSDYEEPANDPKKKNKKKRRPPGS